MEKIINEKQVTQNFIFKFGKNATICIEANNYREPMISMTNRERITGTELLQFAEFIEDVVKTIRNDKDLKTE